MWHFCLKKNNRETPQESTAVKRPYLSALHRRMRQIVITYAYCWVFLLEYCEPRPNSFVGYVQVSTVKTLTKSNCKELVAYPVHVVLLNCVVLLDCVVLLNGSVSVSICDTVRECIVVWILFFVWGRSGMNENGRRQSQRDSLCWFTWMELLEMEERSQPRKIGRWEILI